MNNACIFFAHISWSIVASGATLVYASSSWMILMDKLKLKRHTKVIFLQLLGSALKRGEEGVEIYNTTMALKEKQATWRQWHPSWRRIKGGCLQSLCHLGCGTMSSGLWLRETLARNIAWAHFHWVHLPQALLWGVLTSQLFCPVVSRCLELCAKSARGVWDLSKFNVCKGNCLRGILWLKMLELHRNPLSLGLGWDTPPDLPKVFTYVFCIASACRIVG